MTGANQSIRPLSPVELQAIIHAERRDLPFLFYRDGDEVQIIRELDPAAARVTLGRVSGVDVQLPWDDEVSRIHAELQAIGSDWALVDDGLSTNGTFVNGRRLTGRQLLRDGDVIRAGNTLLTFRHPGQERALSTIHAGMPTVITLSPTQQRVLEALCRPFKGTDGFATPASNPQIAREVFLSVEAVKTHLRAMYRRFDIDDLPQNKKRARLAEMALQGGIVNLREL